MVFTKRTYISTIGLQLILSFLTPFAVFATEVGTQDNTIKLGKKQNQTATSLYAAGDFSTAATLFHKAYKKLEDASLLYNAAQAEIRSTQYEKALRTLKRYQRLAPNISWEKKEQIDKDIMSLQRIYENNSYPTKGTLCVAKGPYNAVSTTPRLNPNRVLAEVKQTAASHGYEVDGMKNWNCSNADNNSHKCLKKQHCNISMYIGVDEKESTYTFSIVTLNVEKVYPSSKFVKVELTDGNFWGHLRTVVKYVIERSGDAMEEVVQGERDLKRVKRVLMQISQIETVNEDKSIETAAKAFKKRTNRFRNLAFTAGSIAIGLGAASLITQIIANKKYDKLNNQDVSLLSQADLDSAYNSTAVSVVTGFSAAAMGITSIVLFAAYLKTKEKRPIHISSTLSKDINILFVAGTF